MLLLGLLVQSLLLLLLLPLSAGGFGTYSAAAYR
jgi:hypothetical protein